MRLRSDIWVDAYRRRAETGGAYVMVRRKGIAESGAIFIHIDRLDGAGVLLGPAPQAMEDALEDGGRRFQRQHDSETLDSAAIEARLGRELRFDPDLWIIVVEDRHGRSFLDAAA
mgnify:CR=1 FL=1